MDLLTLFRTLTLGVAFVTPAAPLIQQPRTCPSVRGTITSKGADFNLTIIDVTGCIAVTGDGTYRCSPEGTHLYLRNGRSTLISWDADVTYEEKGELDPYTDRLLFLPNARPGKDTPPVTITVSYCE
jgi:hypothetical protein